MKIFRKRSIWVLMTAYMSLWLVAVMLGGIILNDYKNVINATLGLSGVRTETIDTGVEEDLEYFKSDYVQYDENGNVLYTTDKDGYKHQLYDDKALRKAALEKASQVQREGTTILWNTDNSGLPLEKGNKVSLFSHSTVDWVYSGGGSGQARTNGASDMKKALTNAGLSVNSTLWDFYKSGNGASYTRTNRYKMNEVPWSVYTETVKKSFASYGDAAIIVLSRRAGEGSVAQGGAFDVTQTEADTPSGDYYDMSVQEKNMIEEVVAAKKAGTFKKVIVLLNTATDMWLAPLLEYKADIDCCMWVGQTGYQGLNEVGKILVGDSIPSGHLVDTFLQNTQSNPAFVNSIASAYTNASSMKLSNMGYQAMYLTYAESIYVGYKYYETRYEDAVLGRGNATSTAGAVNSASNWSYSEEVAFPFGHGVAYTAFEYSNYKVEKNESGNYDVTLTVQNMGAKKGADAVQVYIQRPYTDYDRQNGVEQAAVNLVGYAKTKELSPGEKVNVKITVRSDAFRTYDANNAETYIREKTNGIDAYYMTAAQDAHEAVNNILAAKGKTPANTDGKMDAEGNVDMVETFTFDTDDFETYATSETGVKIINQFDDTDWNKYENKTDGTLVYLSRNDWQATYPTAPIKLSLNDKMVYDLSWNKEVEKDPKDKMPTYGAKNGINLVTLRGREYDDPTWELLLDQMTLEEQYTYLGSAYHGTKAITSIGKPAEVTKDGPLGVKQKYQTNSSEYTLSFPSTTLLAASYNDKLAEEVGELMGEDMIHAGVTGIYAPGANIHRMTYSGRNYEYYSEDGFMTGMMAKWQTIGIQSKGCYVNIKHIALNDQENNRYGVGIWANEQSIREIYLPAFEYVVKEGNCTGLMSAFNRFGTVWSGAHKGLLTNVLREEWGYKGFVISDCAWRVYMGVVDGVMAGNDCILDDADLTAYKAAEKNATIALAIRESVHRVLYVVVNSNAMNGLSANTRIYEVNEWWQDLIVDVQMGVAIATGAMFVLTVISFLIPKGKSNGKKSTGGKSSKLNGKSKATAKGKKGGKALHKGVNLFKTLITLALSAVLAVVSLVAPTTLKNLPTDFMAKFMASLNGSAPEEELPEENTSLKDLLEGEVNTYKFEAETAILDTDIARCGQGWQADYPASSCNYPSGQGYIYYLTDEGNATITFNITASQAGPAVLSYAMGCTTEARLVSDIFSLKVNGTDVAYHAADIEFPVYSSVKYFDWKEVEVAMIDLVAGENTITLTKNVTGLNFDYIALTSAATLQDTRCVSTHTYTDWNVSEPTYDRVGKADTYCVNCCKEINVSLPVISEANGYTKEVVVAATETTYGSANWSYTDTQSAQTFTFTRSLYPTSATVYTFEAEAAEYTGTASRYNDSVYDTSNNAYLGKLAGATWTITYNVLAEEASDALLLMRIGRRNDRDVVFASGKTLTVNGENVAVSSDVVFKQIESTEKYMNWAEYEMVHVNLKKGVNKIVLANAGSAFTNLDYIKLVSTSELSWFSEGMEHEHTYSENVVAVAPTYEKAGEIGSYCDVCGTEYKKVADLPAISVENGYTKISSGATSVWTYSYEGVTFTVNVEETNAVTYTFTAGAEKDPFTAANGGSTTSNCVTEAGIEGHFYGNTNGGENSYSMTVTVEEATNVTFIIKGARRSYTNNTVDTPYNPKFMSYTQTDLFGSIKLNDTTDGVVYTDDKLEGCGTDSAAWGNFKDFAVATLNLKAGVNKIDFTVICAYNIQAISFKSVVPVTLGAPEGHTHTYGDPVVEVEPTYYTAGELGAYCTVCLTDYKKVADLPAIAVENGYTQVSTGAVSVWEYVYEGKTYTFEIEEIGTYTFTILDDDPFVAEKGGSTVTGGYDGFGLMTNKYGTFYQNTRLGTFTLTVNVPKAANVDLSIFVASTNGYTFDLADVFTAVTLNGGTEGVTKATGSVSTVGWYVSTATEAKIATLALNAGTNVISFTMGDTSKTLNIGSVVFKSPVVVALGSATAHTHSFTLVPEVPAACETTGTKAYYKCECGVMASDEAGENVIKAVETIPVLGHTEVVDGAKAPTCTETGLTEGKHCSVCEKVLVAQNTVDALGHTEETVAGKAATCTETGLKDGKKCTVCGETTLAQEVIPALGHKDEDNNYKCDECEEILCETHVEEILPAKAATCTEAGLTEGKKCANCGQILLAQEVVDASGHNIVTDVAVAPTCTVTGLTEGSHCTKCNDATVAQTVVDALGHNIVTDEAKAPTCTETGLTEGQYCTRCSDEKVEQTVIAALGHTLAGEWTLSVAPTYEAEGSLTKNCSVCSQDVAEALPMISEANGYTKVIGGVLSRWTYVKDTQTFTFDITETVETTTYSWRAEAWYVSLDGTPVGKEGYKYTTGPWDGTNLSFGTSGSAYLTTIVVSEPTTATLIIRCARNKAKPFFTTDGSEHVLNNLQVNGSADNVICDMNAQLSVTGWHAYTDYEVAVVFLKAGANTISFSAANNTNFQGIGFKATQEIHMHTDVIDAAVAPTCSEKGLTEGIHCSVCNEVVFAQEEVPATGHVYEWTLTTAPTYNEVGTISGTCTDCGNVATEEIPEVSEENGYVKLATGVSTRWSYTYGQSTLIIDLMEEVEATNYAFTADNAYNRGLASHNSTYNAAGYFGDTSGDVFTTTISVPKATSVKFIIKGGTKNTRSYSGATIISSLTVNNQTDNYFLTTELTKFEGWTTWVNFHAATLYLEEGVNVITFSLSSNLNIAGISFDSMEEVTRVYDSVNLSLMAFNIRQDTDSGVKAWANRKDALINMVIGYNPSVITFQEVKQNQANDLTTGLAAASYDVVWYGRQTGSNPEGLAIAYKTDVWEKVSESRFWLSETPDEMSKGWGASYYRICVNVLLKHKATGEHLNVFNVHLDFTDAPKVNGIKLIMSKAAETDYPTYIAGDFNDGLTGAAYQATKEQYRDTREYAPVTDYYTTCSEWGAADDTALGGQIDHCFVSAKHFVSNEFKVLRTRLEDNFYPSDHFAVMANVEMLVSHVHTETVDAAKDATCTETGLTEGKHCSVCDKVLVKQDVIDAKGHTEVADAAKDPTCTETGLTAGSHCSVCNEVIVAQNTVDALGHTEETVAGYAATCTETGLKDGKKCTVCGETTLAQEVIPALGHKDENGDYKCDECQELLCTNHVEEILPAKSATCTEAGLTEGKKCANCGQILLAQEVIDASGHNIVTDAAVAATCTATGLTEGSHCTKCNDATVAQTVVDALGHNIVTLDAVAPTCTTTGLTAGQYCTRCSDEKVEQTVVAALGHTLAGEWTLSVAPTYEAEGSLANSCSVCSAALSEVLPVISEANGYTKVIGGVLSCWTYTYGEQTYTFDITETVETTTYSWKTEAWCVALEGSKPIVKDGYKSTGDTALDTTNNSFGGSGITYVTTVVVSEPTTATLIIRCARNKAKPFFTAGTEHCIDNLYVNGSADNVICNMSAQLSVAGWHAYTDYEVAVVFLKAGANTISFKSATTVNFQGIGFKATEEIHMHTDVIDAGVTATCTTEGLTEGIHCSVCNEVIVAQEVIPASGAHTWGTEYSVATVPTYLTEGQLAIQCVTCNSNNEESFVTMPVVSEENGYVKVDSTDSEDQWQYVYGEQTFDIVIPTLYEFTVADNDPFLAENGGSVVQGTAEGSTAVGKNTNQYGTFYEKTKGATFTLRINAAEAMDVNFVIKVSSTADYTFDLADVVTAITLNGEETGVVRKDGTVSTTGWYVSDAGSAEIATLSLQKGVNVISFTAGTATSKTLNIGAIVLSSAEYSLALVTPCAQHTEEVVSAKAATCTETGLTEGKKCSVCAEVILAQEVISALGHTEETVAGYAATCTETGLKDGKKCTVCGETTLAQEVIPALGHKDEDNNYKCDECEEILCETHVEEILPAKAATCTEAGLTEGKKCANCGQILLAQEVIDASGHNIVTDEAVAPTCTTTGLTEGSHCTKCNDMTVAQTVIDALGHNVVTDLAKAATCTETGLTEGSHCAVCNEVLTAQGTIDALGHTEAAAVVENAVAPDFANAGSLERVVNCSVCSAEVNREEMVLPALNFVDYTSATTASGTTATTVFAYNSDKVDYSVTLTSTGYITINDTLYSRYDVAKLSSDAVSASYDETNGFTYHAASEQALTFFSNNGANLTLTGTITVNATAQITVAEGNLQFGTDTEIANVTVKSTVANSIAVNESANRKIIISKGSTLNMPDNVGNAIRFAQKKTCNLDVYGTAIIAGLISGNRYHIITVYEGGNLVCGSINNGQSNQVKVYGSMTVNGNFAQTKNSTCYVYEGGSLKIVGNYNGDNTNTMNVSGTLDVSGNVTVTAFTVGATGIVTIGGTSSVTPTITAGGKATINGELYE